VNRTEQIDSDALPLAAAAARLGISSDALRMRINRGKIRGFKRGGRLFAVLEEAPNQAQRTARAGTEQTAPGRFEQARHRPASVRSPGAGPSRAESGRPTAAPEPGEPSLPLVVEFQKVELSRLLRDNSRLNRRLDQFMDEMRHLREIQQREQVLRQQDQALRQRTQALIERLTAPPGPAPLAPALPASVPPASVPPASELPASAEPAPELPASAAPASAPPRPGPIGPGAVAPKNVPTARDSGPSVSAAGSESAAPAAVSGDSAAKAGGVGEPLDLPPRRTTYAYGEGAAAPAPPSAPPPGVPPEAPPGPPNQPGESWRGAHRDTAELADMLKDIGASLRALDSTAAGAPGPAEPDPTAGRAPATVPGARRAPGDLAGPPADDEAGLLEILGRMGPSAEERRTAARLMKRLFKGRAARRRGEPGDDAD
jgi:hypothetical protein